MKKVTFFIGTLTSGGAERVVSILSQKFLNDFDEVEIILYYDRPIWYRIDSKVKILTLPNREDSAFPKLRKMVDFRNIIKDSNTDCVISFLAPFNMFAILSLFFLNIKLIVADRNDPSQVPNLKLMRFLRNILYGFATEIIVQTESNKNYFSKYIQNKTTVIANPIFVDATSKYAFNRPKEKKIVSVGRLVEQKNHKLLIDSFEIVLKQHGDHKLYIYGEGPERKSIEKYIEEKNLESKVILAGAKKNIDEHILDAKCFVLTSKFEGMPNALLEAMALGLPVVSTNVSGAKDLILTDYNGILILHDDVTDIAKSILKIIENPRLAFEIGCNASKLRDDLSVENIYERWIEVLNRVVGEKI